MKLSALIFGTVYAMAVLNGCVSGPVNAQAQDAAATSAHYTWRNVKIVAGGFVDGIVFNPAAKDVLYARTDIGGAYRWDAAAQRWIPLLDWIGPADWNLTGVESIGVDPSDANRVYLAVGTYTGDWAGNGAILRSDDQGRTWQRTDLPFKNGGNMDGRSAGERLAVDPNDGRVLFFGSRNNGLWHSVDYGVTWTQVGSFPVQGATNGTGVVWAQFQRTSGVPGKPTPVVYVGVEQDGPGLYRSGNGGATWQVVPGQPTGLLPHHGVLTPDGGTLYVTYTNAPGPNGVSAGAVWKLDTKTGAWTDVTPIPAGQPGASGYAGLAVDAQHPQTVMVSTLDRWNPGDTLFRTTDGGHTWANIGPQTVRDWARSPYVTFGKPQASLGWWLGALAIDPFRSGHVLYGTGATIWASHDVTQADRHLPTHWAVGAEGVEETAVLALISPPSGPPLVSGLGDIGGFTHANLDVSPPGGMMRSPQTDNISSLDFAGQAPQVIVRVDSGSSGQRGGISQDGGTTWTPFFTEPEGSQGRGTIAVSADGRALVWSEDRSAPAVSRDSGRTWTPCVGLPRTARVLSDRKDASTFYALDSRSGALFVSHDAGASFKSIDSNLGQGAQIYVAPDATGDLWLTIGGSVSHSTDGGATFQPVPTIAGVKSLGFGKAAPGQTYPALFALGTVGGVAAIYRSDNKGANWVRINDAQHQYATADLIIGDPRVYGRAYVGTNGRGILVGDLR